MITLGALSVGLLVLVLLVAVGIAAFARWQRRSRPGPEQPRTVADLVRMREEAAAHASAAAGDTPDEVGDEWVDDTVDDTVETGVSARGAGVSSTAVGSAHGLTAVHEADQADGASSAVGGSSSPAGVAEAGSEAVGDQFATQERPVTVSSAAGAAEDTPWARAARMADQWPEWPTPARRDGHENGSRHGGLGHLLGARERGALPTAPRSRLTVLYPPTPAPAPPEPAAAPAAAAAVADPPSGAPGDRDVRSDEQALPELSSILAEPATADVVEPEPAEVPAGEPEPVDVPASAIAPAAETGAEPVPAPADRPAPVVAPVAAAQVAPADGTPVPTPARVAGRVRRSPSATAAEQAAADLALLRTFGVVSRRAAADEAEVELEGCAAADDEPAAGVAQPVVFLVVGRDGGGVPAASVTLLDDHGRESAGTAADADGRGTLTARHPGGYMLVTSAAGYQPGAITIAVADGPVEVEIPLARSATIVGTVSGEDGPVVGAQLALVQDGEIVDTAESAADGAYRFADLAGGEYGLSVSAPECEPAAVVLRLADEADLRHDVDLDPAGLRTEGPTDDVMIGHL